MSLRLTLCALVASLLAGPALATEAGLTVEGSSFVLTTSAGRLTSTDLIGAEMEAIWDGEAVTVRIDSVTPDADHPSVLLHDFRVRNAAGQWVPLCESDVRGRTLGFPVAGRWATGGVYVKDPERWFLTCTSGSQAKCILWGYDPWGAGPRGEPLDRLYQACQHTVRADYDGQGEAHTRNGTEIDVFDSLGVQVSDTGTDPIFAFEAGWGPDGAVCVARTRWPDLLPVEKLWKEKPALAAPCDEATARAMGAVIFTRVKVQ